MLIQLFSKIIRPSLICSPLANTLAYLVYNYTRKKGFITSAPQSGATTTCIMTLSIEGLFVTLSINDTDRATLCHYAECRCAVCHYPVCHCAECHYPECHCAECCYSECQYPIIMLNVVMLSVIMHNVIILSVVILSVIMLSAIMLNAIILSVILLSVIMLSVYILSVVAPLKAAESLSNFLISSHYF